MTAKAQLDLPAKTPLDLPILDGTLGPSVVDVTPLAKRVFTYDPGFMSTAACASKITLSTVIKACYFTAVIQLSN